MSEQLFKNPKPPLAPTGYLDIRPGNKVMLSEMKENPQESKYFANSSGEYNKQYNETNLIPNGFKNLLFHTLAHIDNRESFKAGLPIQACLDSFLAIHYNESRVLVRYFSQAVTNRLKHVLEVENRAVLKDFRLVNMQENEIHGSYKLILITFFLINLSKLHNLDTSRFDTILNSARLNFKLKISKNKDNEVSKMIGNVTGWIPEKDLNLFGSVDRDLLFGDLDLIKSIFHKSQTDVELFWAQNN
jgi:hypothetical protein